jgi:hypothetical protein
LPAASIAHRNAIAGVIEEIAEREARSVEGLMQAGELAEFLTDLLETNGYQGRSRFSPFIIALLIAGFSVRVYGSCLTSLALTTSDLNLELLFPVGVKHADALDRVSRLLVNRGE